MYKIEFTGFFPASAQADGYLAKDFLPGYLEQTFRSRDEAEAFIRAEHLGPDCDGVTAKFAVEIVDEPWTPETARRRVGGTFGS